MDDSQQYKMSFPGEHILDPGELMRSILVKTEELLYGEETAGCVAAASIGKECPAHVGMAVYSMLCGYFETGMPLFPDVIGEKSEKLPVHAMVSLLCMGPVAEVTVFAGMDLNAVLLKQHDYMAERTQARLEAFKEE